MQRDCKDLLGGTGGAESADHKISFLRHKFVRKLKAGYREFCEAECVFTVSTEKVQMGIIRIGAGTIGWTECVLGTVTGVINTVNQPFLFKSF